MGVNLPHQEVVNLVVMPPVVGYAMSTFWMVCWGPGYLSVLGC